MDFLKNMFGAKKDDQNNFTVDESGNAVDSSQDNLKMVPDHSQDGPVGETKAFDELVSQAENSAHVSMPETPVVDPEFQKAQEEAKKEGIEIDLPEGNV